MIDTRTLTPLQRELHAAGDPSQGVAAHPNRLHSDFFGHLPKATYYEKVIRPLQRQKLEGVDVERYLIDRSFPVLLQTSLIISLPTVNLKTPFKGTWCHDIDRTLFNEVSLFSGDTLVQKFTPETARLMERLFPANFKYSWRSGNTLVLTFPWFFSEDASKALPLVYAGEGSEFYHTITSPKEIDVKSLFHVEGGDASSIESIEGEIKFEFEAVYAKLTDMEIAVKKAITNHTLDSAIILQPCISTIVDGIPTDLPEGHYSHLFWWASGEGEIKEAELWGDKYEPRHSVTNGPFAFLRGGSEFLHYWGCRTQGDPLYPSPSRMFQYGSIKIHGTGRLYLVGMKASILRITPSNVRITS